MINQKLRWRSGNSPGVFVLQYTVYDVPTGAYRWKDVKFDEAADPNDETDYEPGFNEN